MSLYRFDDYQLDPRARRLTRDGRDIAAEPRVLDLVVYLIEHRERAVGRDELIAAVWGKLDSSDSTLAQAVLKARRLFGDDGNTQRTIRTVARFGYQWVAPIDATAPSEASVADSTPIVEPPHVAVASTNAARRRAMPFRWFAIGAAMILIAVLATAWQLRSRDRDAASATPSSSLVSNLILVAPANVRSAVAEDSWMRLGVMAMVADALHALPNHAVVANETALATVGDHALDVASLRTKSGAATVVTIDAHRENDRWLMDATVHRLDGSSESVDADADDAVVAAGALAERIRAAFAPDERGSSPSPDRLALAARMQAAILDGHAEHALALADAASPTLAAEPDIVLLRARALNRVGRATEATAVLDALIARAGNPAPPWLALAWSTRGYSALVEGAPETAEQNFRRALTVSGNDRNEIGRAWRGLGNAQAARGAFGDAEASYLRARLELSAGGDRLLLAHLLDDLGTVAARRGRFDEAVEHYRDAANAAAALGATEIELGARMNVALAEEERLHHHAALDAWRELLPRVQALQYPSMHRYATVHYADALAETGASSEAATVLDSLARAPESSATHDALEDVAADRLRVRLEIGDARAAADEARAIATVADAHHAAAIDALRLEVALAANDDGAAQTLANRLADASAHEDVATATALALWWRRRGDDAKADASAHDAVEVARSHGSPRDLRDAAVSFATARLSRGDVDDARTLAALVESYASEDFAITLLLARVAAAAGDVAGARQHYDAAHTLSGERWTAALAAEAADPSLGVGPRITAVTLH